MQEQETAKSALSKTLDQHFQDTFHGHAFQGFIAHKEDEVLSRSHSRSQSRQRRRLKSS